MDKKMEMINTYNQSAAALVKKFNSLGGYPEDIEKTFSFVQNKDNPKVFEIGCGGGRDARDILRYTNNYTSIDISEEFIKHAREEIPNTNFIVADVDEFDFPKDIDAIFAFASLLHSDKESIGQILEKAYESLNEHGVVFLSLKYGEYKEVRKTDEFGTRTFYYYTPETLKELAGEKFKTVFENQRNFRDQEWFNIIFQKQ